MTWCWAEACSTLQLLPPSKPVTEGWNLIGYFGTDGDDGYEWDEPDEEIDRDGKEAYNALQSLVNTFIGFPKWSSLWTYWEPYNTDGNPGTSVWVPFSECESLDPGAGYWIEMDEGETYVIPTNDSSGYCG